jgi:hypothetical protein
VNIFDLWVLNGYICEPMKDREDTPTQCTGENRENREDRVDRKDKEG